MYIYEPLLVGNINGWFHWGGIPGFRPETLYYYTVLPTIRNTVPVIPYFAPSKNFMNSWIDGVVDGSVFMLMFVNSAVCE